MRTLRTFRSVGQHQGRYALSGTKVGILQCLTSQDARVSALAHQLSVSVSVASRAVEGLESDGLVCRHSDQEDGRVSVISITPRGTADLAQRHYYIAERFASVLDDWAPANTGQVLVVLQQLNDRLDRLADVLESDAREAGRS
ncbi:MarR family winged helix-turn-helix transcriptional regulator [Brevibacterium yomogidense]|uniref:MarR family winged helix-turn-helix transcriptional regulator n=1 Tax=Brevibacterium yomogidense TaxID=946573 RepID=UPI0038CBFD45